MHAATVSKSKRLQDVLKVLADGQEHTTFEIQQATGSMAPATDVSELRHQGFDVVRRYAGKNQNGRQVNFYKWVQS